MLFKIASLIHTMIIFRDQNPIFIVYFWSSSVEWSFTAVCYIFFIRCQPIFHLCIFSQKQVYRMECTGNCLNTKAGNLTLDFSGFKTINGPKGFRSDGLINVTRDIKGALHVRYFIRTISILTFCFFNQ